MTHYTATDDDLPDFDALPAPDTPKPHRDAAVQQHYPEFKYPQPKREPRSQTAASVEADLREDNHRKQYVRWPKRAQVWDILRALVVHDGEDIRFPGNDWECRFCRDLWNRFETYGHDVKWITRKQYDALLAIAAKFAPLPRTGQW